MAYDTAADIIAAACAECGLTPVADPYASLDDAQIQMRTLLNQCGRELYTMHQWQQFVRQETISTGADPSSTDPSGKYDLPDDFGYFINQTGWSPISAGSGLPLGGPITRQQSAYLVATGLSTVVQIYFDIHRNQLAFIPAPAPADIDITYEYISNGWVFVHGSIVTVASLAENADDVIVFEPILISKMLTTRYKQAKGLDASASLEQFQNMFAQFTGVNKAAPILNLATRSNFPYLNPWNNLPYTGYGS